MSCYRRVQGSSVFHDTSQGLQLAERGLRVEKLHSLTVFPRRLPSQSRWAGRGCSRAVSSTEATQLSCPPAMPDPVYSGCSARAWLPSAIPTVLHTIPILGTYGDGCGSGDGTSGQRKGQGQPSRLTRPERQPERHLYLEERRASPASSPTTVRTLLCWEDTGVFHWAEAGMLKGSW